MLTHTAALAAGFIIGSFLMYRVRNFDRKVLIGLDAMRRKADEAHQFAPNFTAKVSVDSEVNGKRYKIAVERLPDIERVE